MTLSEEISRPFSLEYLRQMRVDNMFSLEETQNINKMTRYSTGFEVLKKALNLSISLDCDDELLDILHRFIEDKQRLNIINLTSTNNESLNSAISVQMSDPFVIRKREAPTKTYRQIYSLCIKC